MAHPESKRAAPAATGNGSKSMQKPLSFRPESYSRIRQSATPANELAPIIERTIAEHGLSALGMPKRAAALHEAGHAVLYAAEGEHVKSIRIKCINFDGERAWGGRTFGGSPWQVGTHTDPAMDLRQARMILAGVVSEAEFDPMDFREGSSLDELILGKKICMVAATKIGRPPAEVAIITLESTRRTLLENENVVRALALELERHHWVRGAKLTRLLASVQRLEPLR